MSETLKRNLLNAYGDLKVSNARFVSVVTPSLSALEKQMRKHENRAMEMLQSFARKIWQEPAVAMKTVRTDALQIGVPGVLLRVAYFTENYGLPVRRGIWPLRSERKALEYAGKPHKMLAEQALVCLTEMRKNYEQLPELMDANRSREQLFGQLMAQAFGYKNINRALQGAAARQAALEREPDEFDVLKQLYG